MKSFCCLLCGGGEYELIKDRTRDSSHKVVKCLECGMTQLYPLPSVEEDEEYYNMNSHDKKITPSYTIEELYEKFKFHNQTKINYLEKYGINKKWKMLDFGCGYGFFIQMMREKGYDFDGIEISKDRLSICQKRLGAHFKNIRNINLLIEDVSDDLIEKYNLITMFHLLEHILKPHELLNKIAMMLKPDGLLVIEVPNIDNLMMLASKEFNDFFYIRDHVAYYRPDLLKKVVEECGFEILLQKGNQIYGLTNHMNWIINRRPELKNPSYESCEAMKWIEDVYKMRLNENLKSEYMYVIAKKSKDFKFKNRSK